MKLKGNTTLERAMSGVRPVSMGMLLAVALTLSLSTFRAGTGGAVFAQIRWNFIAVAAVCGFVMFRYKISIPKTILLAAVLGFFLG